MTDRPLRPHRVLLHPLWVGALALLLVNDHLLKGADVLPAALTGKLSDVAGLLVAPAVLATLLAALPIHLRPRDRRGLALSHVAVGIGFAAINLLPAVARAVESLTATLGLPWRIWCDPTDLIALPILVLGHRLTPRVAQHEPTALRSIWSAAAERGVFALALLGCIATSRAPPPRVSAGPGQLFVPLGYGAERVALVDAATGRDAGELATPLSSSPRPALIAGVLVGSEGYGGGARGRLVGIDPARATPRFAVDAGDLVTPVIAHGTQAIVARIPSGEHRRTLLSSWDVEQGRHLWDHPLADRYLVVLHHRGDLLVVGGEQSAIRLDPATGRALWQIAVREEAAAITSLGDRVYLHLDDGKVLALDAASGRELQRLDVPSHPWQARHLFDASLVASDRSLFLLVDDGVLVLDAQLRRRRLVPGIDRLYVEQGVVLGIEGNVIAALDPLTGAPRWRFDDADFWYDSPTIAAGAIYLGGDEHVVAVDAATGRHRWRWTYPEER